MRTSGENLDPIFNQYAQPNPSQELIIAIGSPDNDNNAPPQTANSSSCVAKVDDHPNNGFSRSLELPRQLWSLILEFTLSGKSGKKDAVSFAQVCKLFCSVYFPFSPIVHLDYMKQALQEQSVNENLRRVFEFCYFVTFSKVKAVTLPTRIAIIREIQRELRRKVAIPVDNNPVSTAIQSAFNWPRTNEESTVGRQEFLLALYQEFHSSGFSHWLSPEKHAALMTETSVTDENSKIIASTLMRNLHNFIKSLNAIISDIRMEGCWGALQAGGNTVFYHQANSILSFFLSEMPKMKFHSDQMNTYTFVENPNFIKKISGYTISPIRSCISTHQELIRLFFGIVALGTSLGGISTLCAAIIEKFSDDYDPQSFNDLLKPSVILLAIGIAAFAYFLIARPMIRNCSAQRLSDNIHRLCPGSRRNRIEVLDENSPLLINEANRQIAPQSDLEPAGSDIEQGIFEKKY